MVGIVLAFALVALYAHVQKLRRSALETVVFTPGLPETPKPTLSIVPHRTREKSKSQGQSATPPKSEQTARPSPTLSPARTPRPKPVWKITRARQRKTVSPSPGTYIAHPPF